MLHLLSKVLTLAVQLLCLIRSFSCWLDRTSVLARFHCPALAVGLSPGSGEPGPMALARGSLAASRNKSCAEGRRHRGAQCRRHPASGAARVSESEYLDHLLAGFDHYRVGKAPSL